MHRSSLCLTDVFLWSFVLYLATYVPSIEMRTNDDEMQKYVAEQPQASSPSPEPLTTVEEQKKRNNSCFHMPRSKCPPNGTACTRIDPVSVFCCDVDSFRFKEALQIFRQNTSNLHVLNATLDKLNVSEAMYRRLVSMSFTDGNIGMIVGQFPKHSSIACLNISNNNLTSKKLDPSNERPFAHLIYLTYLDASANNLTEFPLSLVQSNRKITVDFSGNDYIPCKHFLKAMESKIVYFHNYEKTRCALDVRYNWFMETTIVNIDYLHQQKELHKMCKFIRPENINCTCSLERLELLTEEAVNLISVDCSQRGLKEMPTNLPTNTVKLNVSHNNITSLQPMSDDPSYDQLKQLIVDYNDITSIVELEGTKFIDNFMLFSITHNKLSAIHTYVLSNKFDMTNSYTTFSIAGNYIHCDCNTEKVFKPWLMENSKNIPDYRHLMCEENTPVVDLFESQVCHANRDWTDYIYYIIALEVLVLVLLISKVSYDYWVFKTAGYLPWPANKMPRLPCDWLCE
ncbi:protein halfway isoform X2 [Hyposmocoma kahamanoa]|uniref:protein halfway isoform X2 n=1 Tax=Hyposmocoma kahamanoa TaxID=1477025 RepID=UPI000E6D83C2|nr:protein halfway isoform X2 [Hyposmocoma kahamanoa]